MYTNDSGFSLIELLVVITIIGILASISIPSYRHYIQRARFTELILAVEPYKTAVTIALQSGAPIEELREGAYGIPQAPKATQNLQSLSIEAGVITAMATPSLGGYSYVVTPDVEGEHWVIGGTCLDVGLCHL